jgi:hypothetical protein
MRILFGLWMGFLCLAIVQGGALAQIPHMMSYQGVLLDAGQQAVPDGDYALSFAIYSVETGGSPLWTEYHPAVPVRRGIFNVALGESNPIDFHIETQLWLGISVAAEAELPRMWLAASPYALRAEDANTVGQRAVSGTPTPNAILPLGASGKFPPEALPEGLPPGGAAGGDLTGSYPSPSIAPNAVTGAEIADQTVTGIDIDGNSELMAKSVYASNSSPMSWAIYGLSPNAAVWGDNVMNGTTGLLGTAGAGVIGWGTPGFPAVYGLGDGSDGLVGESNTGYGAIGTSDSQVGVYGESTENDGVSGVSNTAYRSGVYGVASNGNGYGLYGYNSFNGNTGFVAGPSNGIYGTSDNGWAVAGEGWAGVYGYSDAESGNGVYGIANTGAAAWGVHGASSEGIGVHGFSDFGCAVYAFGSFIGTGSKSAKVKRDDGSSVLLFCEESAEVYFSDYGEGQLVEGHAHIDLDPVFLQTVTINASNPLKAFVQLEGDCKGVYITNKTARGFDVVELQGGASNAPFSYRVMCKRKYFEGARLSTEQEVAAYNRDMMQAAWPDEVAAKRDRFQRAESRVVKGNREVVQQVPAPARMPRTEIDELRKLARPAKDRRSE